MAETRNNVEELFDELKPGDRIEVQRAAGADVKEGSVACRCIRTQGCVVRTERRHHPTSRGGQSEQPVGDVILLELADGELASVAVDEATVLRRA